MIRRLVSIPGHVCSYAPDAESGGRSLARERSQTYDVCLGEGLRHGLEVPLYATSQTQPL